MEVKIEKLQKEDLDKFWEVFVQVLKKDFPGYTKAVTDYFINKIYTKTVFNHWLSTGWKIGLLAKSGRRISGFSVLDKPYGGVCFCRWLGVLPEFRKKGIGRGLIRNFISYAKNYGCHKVEIASQFGSKEFYEKCGLILEGKRICSYFGIDQFIFGKQIGRPKDEVMTRD